MKIYILYAVLNSFSDSCQTLTSKSPVRWKVLFYKLMKTHYDILNLDKNCSAKEIKDSFLNLSKKYHPDINKESNAHKKFVEVNEAYSVLGKADKRLQYDRTLFMHSRMTYENGISYPSYMRPYEYYGNHYKQPQGFYNNSHSKVFKSRIRALVFCYLVIVIGTGIQIRAVYKNRYHRSQEIAASLAEAMEHNKNLTKEERFEEFRKRYFKNNK